MQARGHHDRAWYSQLFDADGKLLFSTSTTPPSAPQPSGAFGSQPETVAGYRILEKTSRDENHPEVTVRVGTSMPVVHTDMDRIDRLVAIGGMSVLLAAPITGFVLATLALRPITEMTERTDRLHPQRLDERLPLRGTKDELDRLAVVINNLLTKIEQYVGHHRGLMADAAHQLRTPLAAIRSSVEVVLNAEENSPENGELLGKVIEQIESLESLVNQLLLLAETEVDTLRLTTEQVQLDDIVQRSIDMFDAVAESCGVTLNVDDLAPTVVQGNRHHLRQVINNLIDNAIKFTRIKDDDHRSVSIYLTHDRRERRAILKVVDTGIGIESRHLRRVFERFYREDSLQRSEAGVRGNGLGLPIVKSVVESHGGEVAVESSLGIGTTFTITLPLSSSVVSSVV
jgi:signal transduction histidine kinase